MSPDDHRVAESLLGPPLRALADAYRRAVATRFEFHEHPQTLHSRDWRVLYVQRLAVLQDLERALHGLTGALDALHALDALADALAARDARQARPANRAPRRVTRRPGATPPPLDLPF